METDLIFLQDIFKKFCPAKVSRKPNGKSFKKPLFKGWLRVTPEESVRLARCADYQHGPFMFLTGKATKYMTVDLDVVDPSRPDHAGKRDGVSYWDEHYSDPDNLNTLIIRTPSGGYHLVYKYHDGIKSGQLEEDVLIDILSDGKGMCFGPGYEIVKRMQPSAPPTGLVQQIIYNQNISVNNYNTVAQNDDTVDYSSELNEILGCDLVWKITSSNSGKAFTVIPRTNLCLVINGYRHSELNHSYLVVTKSRVIARCHSHYETTIDEAISRQIRSLLYPEQVGSSFADFMSDMIAVSVSKSLARSDGFVWRIMDDKPWIYEKLCTYEQFVNTTFSDNMLFLRNVNKFNDVLRYMNNIEHSKFPFLKKNTDYIGFRNCVLNIMTFDVSDNWTKGTIPKHFIDKEFSWDNLNTPLFDGLLSCQLDPDICGYFMAFIGRALFEVQRFDKYGVVPFVKGDSQTGKSTIITIIESMFSPSAAGILNSNNEITFGLESKYEKEILIAHEVDSRFTDKLSSDLFKQMCCGEDVSIPRKNKKAIDVRWRVPMFLFSNIHMPYKDVQGSISRRLAIFKFTTFVRDKITNLEDKIIASELPAIIGKCLLAYKHMLDTVGTRSFWDVCPQYFNDNLDEMKEETDYVYMFLTLPPGDNVYDTQTHSDLF